MTVSLLPANATDQERALELAASRVGDVPVPIRDLWNPETCPVSWLPFLGWHFSVDTWNPDWPEPVRRKVVATAMQIHRVKGTLGALEDALAALDIEAVVSQWFDYGGDPYKFKVDVEVSTRGLSEDEQTTIGAVIENAKNERSQLDQLNFWLKSMSSSPFMGAIAKAGAVITVHPYAVNELTGETAGLRMGIAASLFQTVTINPVGA